MPIFATGRSENYRRTFWVLCFVLFVVQTAAVTGDLAPELPPTNHRSQADELPEKPVLAFLLEHGDLADRLTERYDWLPSEIGRARERAREQLRTLAELRLESDRRLGEATADGRRVASEVRRYNQTVRELLVDARAELEQTVGAERWPQLLAAASVSWQAERVRLRDRLPIRPGGTGRSNSYVSYTVFCTQYFSETAWEIAVPDQYVKFANRDWAYEPGYPDGTYNVRLTRDAATIVEDVPVWDVGPWNLDDNYWNPAGGDPRPRRLYTDLPQGRPEAEAAFYDNYNGGLDQFGRTVLNPGGCDLSLDVAEALGLGYLENDWIQLEYKWEELDGGDETILDNTQVTRLVGPWEVGTASQDKFGADYYWTSTATADVRYCAWSFEVEAGSYDLSLWWPEGGNRAPAAEVGVKQDAVRLLTVNQQANGGRWNSLGTFSFDSGTVLVGLRNGGEPGWVVICDAVRLTALD